MTDDELIHTSLKEFQEKRSAALYKAFCDLRKKEDIEAALEQRPPLADTQLYLQMVESGEYGVTTRWALLKCIQRERAKLQIR